MFANDKTHHILPTTHPVTTKVHFIVNNQLAAKTHPPLPHPAQTIVPLYGSSIFLRDGKLE